MTQGTVVRHLRNIERELGQALVCRNRDYVSLTAVGQSYFEAISGELRRIISASDKIREASKRNIRLTANFGFAQQWLMPRIHRLRDRFPDFNFLFQANDQDEDLSGPIYDLSIRFGRRTRSGFYAWQILREEVFPVCSPTYLRSHGDRRLGEPDLVSFANFDLLEMEQSSHRWMSWEQWLSQGDSPHVLARPQRTFSTFPLLLQTCLSGEGVGLAWKGFVEPFLKTGSLIQLAPSRGNSDRGYFAVFRQGHPAEKLLKVVAEWLVSEGNARTEDT